MHATKLRTTLGLLRDAVAAESVEAYLVGGAVRDVLLDREPPDVDIVVEADAAAMGRRLADALEASFVPLDLERSTVRLVLDGGDAVGTVDLKSMGSGILNDLAQRDFSCDAMAVPLSEAADGRMEDTLVDPYGGLADLRAREIRAIGPTVFVDDPGRLMRAPRLAAQLGFTISDETRRQVRRDAGKLTTVSPERTRDELLRLLEAPEATASLRLLDDLGLLTLVIPELDRSRGVVQPKEHHWDVFNHLMETPGQVERVVEPRACDDAVEAPRFDGMEEYFGEVVTDGHTRLTLLKLTALLHDISKPETKTVEPSGRIRFFGHHTEGAEVADGIARRLRIGRRGVDLIRLGVHHHLRPGQMAVEGELPSGKAVFRYFRDVGDAAIETLYLNMADHLAARGPLMGEKEWSERRRTVEHILEQGLQQRAPESLPKLLDGNDIMECLSLRPGPEVGHLLDLVREAQANGEVATKDEALELVKAGPTGRRA